MQKEKEKKQKKRLEDRDYLFEKQREKLVEVKNRKK
jgi:hypothetical protein